MSRPEKQVSGGAKVSWWNGATEASLLGDVASIANAAETQAGDFVCYDSAAAVRGPDSFAASVPSAATDHAIANVGIVVERIGFRRAAIWFITVERPFPHVAREIMQRARGPYLVAFDMRADFRRTSAVAAAVAA
jgi:hypothetical protein